MLRVRLLSGEEVANVPLQDELSDVKALKQHLHQRHGLPPRFRQRLLLHGEILDDATKLDSTMELELVQLSYCASQAKELITAGVHGAVAEARTHFGFRV